MRQTRAALRAEGIHIDEDSSSSSDVGPSLRAGTRTKRAPLGQIEANTLEQPTPSEQLAAQEQQDEVVMAVSKKPVAKGKGGRKPRAKKPKEPAEREIEGPAPVVVLDDEREATASPASERASEEMNGEVEVEAREVAQVPMRDRADSPPSQAVRKTRRQLAKTAHDTKEASVIEEPAVVQENAKELPRHEDNVEEPTKETEQAEEAAAEGGAEEHDVLETVTASVDEDKTRNPDAALEKLQQAAAEEQKTLLPVESLVKTASEELPPPAQDRSRQPSLRPEDSIEALDALEDAIEEVGRVISNVESSSSPEHEKKDSKNTKISPTPKTATSSKRSSVVGGPATHKKVLSTSRPPSIQPKPLKRASSVRPVTTAGPTHSPKATQERPNYLNSKKRPISVSFPTPPPPPKAVKPPTKSNFQLPGEAVAAKLKAQREERIKREAEEKKNKSEARAKRISTSLANAPVVRQTAASKARMSLMQGEGQGQENKRASVLGPKPSAAKRTTTTAPTDAATKRTSSITITNRNRNVPTAAATTAAKRNIPATNVADPGAIASSSAISTEAKANVAKPRLPSGREIFQREKQDRLEREKQQREKEEAAKKARLQAAERGRLASREWAEKMKAKKAGEKSEAREVEKNENAAVAA